MVLDINLKFYLYPFCGIFYLLQLVHIAHPNYRKIILETQNY